MSEYLKHYLTQLIKKLSIRFILCLFIIASHPSLSWALSNESEVTFQNKTDRFIRYTYDHLNFGQYKKLNFEVFSKAYYGYLNMLEEGKLKPNALLTVCDFSLSSNVKRLWIIDLKAEKILFHTLVAHGQGTGEEFAENFSNTHESHQSSLGFYTTGETYEGGNGYSLKLHGQDGMFNSNAFDRAIVIHAAEYVSEAFAKTNKRLGRSYGCPALPVDVAPKIIDKIKNGHCLFIYHPSKKYLNTSHWITSKLKGLPEEADRMDLKIPVANNPRYLASAAEAKPQPLTPTLEVCDENECGDLISEGDKENFKLDIKTVLIKKEDRASIQDKLQSNSIKK